QLVDKLLWYETVHAAEDLPLFVDNQRRRDRGNPQQLTESIFEVTTLAPPGRFQKRLHYRRVLIGVDGKKHHIVPVPEPLLHLLIEWMLYTARTAPRSPKVHDYHLAAQRGKLQRRAFDGAQRVVHGIGDACIRVSFPLFGHELGGFRSHPVI